MQIHGLALESEDHVHVVNYDPVTGDGETTEAAGHKHVMKNFKLSKDEGNLHEHEFVRAHRLTADEEDMVLGTLTLEAIDEEDKKKCKKKKKDEEDEKSKAAKIESCVKQMKAKGVKKSKAFAVCTAAQNKKK